MQERRDKSQGEPPESEKPKRKNNALTSLVRKVNQLVDTIFGSEEQLHESAGKRRRQADYETVEKTVKEYRTRITVILNEAGMKQVQQLTEQEVKGIYYYAQIMQRSYNTYDVPKTNFTPYFEVIKKHYFAVFDSEGGAGSHFDSKLAWEEIREAHLKFIQ